MPDSSIVALAGVGLLMWFFTSGSTQVRSMDTLVARLLKIADPYLNKDILANYDGGLVRESWITHHMKMPCEGWNEMLKIKEKFTEIKIHELKYYVSNDLVHGERREINGNIVRHLASGSSQRSVHGRSLAF